MSMSVISYNGMAVVYSDPCVPLNPGACPWHPYYQLLKPRTGR